MNMDIYEKINVLNFVYNRETIQDAPSYSQIVKDEYTILYKEFFDELLMDTLNELEKSPDFIRINDEPNEIVLKDFNLTNMIFYIKDLEYPAHEYDLL